MHDNSDIIIAEKIFSFTDLRNKRVLEIGCGNGRITSLLVGKPAVLMAIDPDEKEIREARKKVPWADFIVGTGENLAFSDGFFDRVIFTLSLHHQDSELALQESRRVLKDTGEILVIEPMVDGEVERVFAIVHNENRAKADAQRAILKSGLFVVQWEVFYANWFFDKKEDLSEYIFNYYGLPVDAILAGKIFACLGGQEPKRPIKLSDKMIIHALRR